MRHTESTGRLLSALEQVEAINLDKLMASAVDITIQSYTEPDERPDHMSRVSIPAEFLAPVKEALAEALLLTLHQRRASVKRELNALNKRLGGEVL